MKDDHPSVEYLRECFSIDENSGSLIWRSRPEHHFRSISTCAAWNGRNAGNVAGSLSDGYRRVVINKRSILCHRVIWAVKHGYYPTNYIDHINAIRDDNRMSNLREASASENGCNQGLHSNNSSGIKGVHWCNTHRKWKVCIHFRKKAHSLGYFTDIKLAEAAARSARERLHGEFSRHGWDGDKND